MTQSFEKSECLLGMILADLSVVFSSEERAEVVQFIEVGECGVALETLVALIVEERKQIPLAVFKKIGVLAGTMGLREAIPTNALRNQVQDGPE